jgi:hypothetical protein
MRNLFGGLNPEGEVIDFSVLSAVFPLHKKKMCTISHVPTKKRQTPVKFVEGTPELWALNV